MLQNMRDQIQFKAMLNMRIILAYRKIFKLIMSIVFPVMMVGVALGMSAAIQSTIPKLPASNTTEIPLDTFPLPADGTFGIISTPTQRDLLVSTLTQSLGALRGSNISIRHFESVASYQDSLIQYYRNSSGSSKVFAALSFPSEFSLTTNGDGKIAYKYDILVEATQTSQMLPAVVRIGEQMKQYLLAKSTGGAALYFLDLISLAPTDGFIFDVSLTIVAPFLAYGITFLIPFYAETRVEEVQLGHFDYLATMGLSPLIYYATAFILDLAIYFTNILASLIILLAVQYKGLIKTNFLNWFLPLFSFGPTLVSLSYLLAFAFKKKETAASALGFGVAIIVFLPYFIVYFVAKDNISMAATYLVSLFLPTFGLYQTLSVWCFLN
jgi:hypothetical protein